MLICNVVGARPNFMKIAPVVLETQRRGIRQLLVHTGQHYDRHMSAVFFEELGMPAPDIHMGIGSGSHAEQTARIMISFEKICAENAFDLVVVGGDVNSTAACSLVAAKIGIPVAHVEAGLRSFDRTMPEEINRIVTDHLSELLFTTEESANKNLRREGIAEERIRFVGNCMIDTLRTHVKAALSRSPWEEYGIEPYRYALLTLHRPSNVDDAIKLHLLMDIMHEVSLRMPIVFPAHPRTLDRIRQGNIQVPPSVRVCEPMPYLTFLGLLAKAKCVLTDSGGIQEETTALNIPCLTLRENTERPVTLTCGTNRLVGTDVEKINAGIAEIMAGKWPNARQPLLWDGKAAHRIVDAVEAWAGPLNLR